MTYQTPRCNEEMILLIQFLDAAGMLGAGYDAVEGAVRVMEKPHKYADEWQFIKDCLEGGQDFDADNISLLWSWMEDESKDRDEMIALYHNKPEFDKKRKEWLKVGVV